MLAVRAFSLPVILCSACLVACADRLNNKKSNASFLSLLRKRKESSLLTKKQKKPFRTAHTQTIVPEDPSCSLRESCLLGLTYGLSDIDEETGEFRTYSYDKLLRCIRSNAMKDYGTDLDVDAFLVSKERYWPDYVEEPPNSHTKSEIFADRGLVQGTPAYDLVTRINRLPFVEHWLRTRKHAWITSGLQTAVQMLHLLIVTLRRPDVLGLRIEDLGRIMDGGCGTGYIVSALALHAQMKGKRSDVFCVEYEKWLNRIGRRIAQRGGVYDLANAETLQNTSEENILSQISWVHGDVVLMLTRDGSATPLENFDMIIYGISLPRQDYTATNGIPERVRGALNENGILIGPQCWGDKDEHGYCVGQWRVYQKKSNDEMVEVSLPYVFPTKFIVPFTTEEHAE